MGLDDFKVAMRMRDVIRTIVRDELKKQRPVEAYGTVQAMDGQTAYVLYDGADEAVPVDTGTLAPSVGQVVRVTGQPGGRYVHDAVDGIPWSAIGGIQRVEDLPDLPDDAYGEGVVVFLTTDAKLYRSTGSNWTTAVDGDDIEANSITTNHILAGAITTALIDADTVTATELAALQLEVGKYIEGNYTPGEEGWHIDANGDVEFNDGTFRGTIEASALIANTITADTGNLLTNGDGEAGVSGTELLSNPTFDVNATGWAAGSNTTIARVTTPTQAGAGALSLTKTTSTGIASATTPTGVSGVPVTPGDYYAFSAYVRAATTGRVPTVRVTWYDAAGATLSSSSGQGIADTSGAWAQVAAWGTAPPAAAFAAFSVEFASTPNAEVHYIDTVSFKASVLGWGSIDGSAFASLLWPRVDGTTQQVQLTTLGRRSGSFGVQLTSSGGVDATTPSGFGTTPVPVVPSGAYRFSGYVGEALHNGFLVTAAIGWYTSAGAFISASKYPTYERTDGTGWVLIDVVGNAPATAAFARLLLGVGTPSANVFVDDWTAQRVTDYVGGKVSADLVESTTVVRDATGVVMPVGAEVTFSGGLSSTEDVYAQGGEGGAGDATSIAGIPPGWVPRDGRSLDRNDFHRLFGVIGSEYGAADSAHFDVPLGIRPRDVVLYDQEFDGSTTTYTFAIPSYVRDLSIRVVGNVATASDQILGIQFNGDSANHYLYDAAFRQFSQASWSFFSSGAVPQAQIATLHADSSREVAVEVFVPHIQSNLAKTIKATASVISSVSASPTGIFTGVWNNSGAAVTSVTILCAAAAPVAGGYIEISGSIPGLTSLIKV